MKTITLTDEQFDNLFYYLDEKVNQIVDTSVDYQDSELLEDFEDLFEVYDIIGEIKNEYEKKLERQRQNNQRQSGSMTVKLVSHLLVVLLPVMTIIVV